MAVLNTDHLLEQADELCASPSAGPPRQVDLRRAISAAYYAVFHHLLTAAADEFVGVTKRRTARYALVYRSVDHRALRDLCNEARKPQPTSRYHPYLPTSGLGVDIQAFAVAFLELQERRHAADYDPASRFKIADGQFAIARARSAIARFDRSNSTRRKAFLSLLLFPPR